MTSVHEYEIYAPEYDLCFKQVFKNSKRSPEILCDLLNSVYGYNGDYKIRKIEYKENTLERKESRAIYFDIGLTCYASGLDGDEEEFIFDVEIQRSKQKEYLDRMKIYRASLTTQGFNSESCRKTKGYNSLLKTRVLSFLKESYDEEYPCVFHEFNVLGVGKMEENVLKDYELLNKKEISNDLTTFIQIGKVDSLESDKLKEWIVFINIGGVEVRANAKIKVERTFDNEYINEAIDILETFSERTDTIDEMDKLSMSENALDQAKKAKFEEGKAEGMKMILTSGIYFLMNSLEFGNAKNELKKQYPVAEVGEIIDGILECEVEAFRSNKRFKQN